MVMGVAGENLRNAEFLSTINLPSSISRYLLPKAANTNYVMAIYNYNYKSKSTESKVEARSCSFLFELRTGGICHS